MMNDHFSVSCIKYEYCKNGEGSYNKRITCSFIVQDYDNILKIVHAM